MAKSLLEQLPEVVARGRQQAEKTLEGREERRRAVRKKLVDDVENAATEQEAVKDGYLVDYISGKPVKDGPEEREAVQVFSRMLVEDHGYPSAYIQTRLQHTVNARARTHKAKACGVAESLRCGAIWR
ncbi:MAG: hypothetical protein ACREPQ_19055 [Rhodanobacter sp.]